MRKSLVDLLMNEERHSPSIFEKSSNDLLADPETGLSIVMVAAKPGISDECINSVTSEVAAWWIFTGCF